MKSLLFAALAMAAVPAPARSLTVLELFQSQGCSSCPPAIANVNRLADRPDVLELTFAVTYWDKLGWKDTFGKPEFTARQYAYSRGLHHDNVYTPQVVVNGHVDLPGTDGAELISAIARAAPVTGPDISAAGNTVTIAHAAFAGEADVWLVRFDPRVLNVAIGRGENSGITIAHRNIVRELVRLGTWDGSAHQYVLPGGADPAWRNAILVEGRDGGSILAAMKL